MTMSDNAKLILSFMQEHKTEKDNCFYFVDLLQTGIPLEDIERYINELSSNAKIDVDTTYPQTVYSVL